MNELQAGMVWSLRLRFFHSRRFFSSQAKLHSTTQRLGITVEVCNSLRLAICTCIAHARPGFRAHLVQRAGPHSHCRTAYFGPAPSLACSVPRFLQRTFAISHFCCRHRNGMRQALGIDSDRRLMPDTFLPAS